MVDPESDPASLEEITKLLNSNDSRVEAALYPLIYGELLRMAHRQMAGEESGRTLEPTALVHEAYLRLHGGAPATWSSRAHFFGAAARAMRRILVDRARRRAASKRGGDRERVPFDQVESAIDSGVDVLSMDEALVALEELDQRMAKIVELRFFAGLSVSDTAAALEVSTRTIKREWNVARAWLRRAMNGDSGHGG